MPTAKVPLRRHTAVWSWPSLPAYRIIKYCIIWRRTINVLVRLQAQADLGFRYNDHFLMLTYLQGYPAKQFFLFLHENIFCRYSLEAPRRGASNEYPQYMFAWRNKKYLYILVKNAHYLELCCPSIVSAWLVHDFFFLHVARVNGVHAELKGFQVTLDRSTISRS